MNESEPDHETMLRWLERAQDHRTSVSDQFLTYAGVLLGLEDVQLLVREDSPLKWGVAFEVAAFFAGLSFVVGCAVVLLRLRDARLAARISTFQYEGRPDTALDAVRRSSERLGTWIDRLIPTQVIAFFLAVAAMIAWILTAGWQKR